MSSTEADFDNCAVRDLLDKTMDDQPFYVAELSDVVNKYRYWRSKLPRVEVFYSVKSNPDPMVIRLMVALGIKFDCASKGEIKAVLSSGALASDIIYAHTCKSIASLLYAASVNVDLMTFDGEEELFKIKNFFPQARLVMRIKIPNVEAVFKLGCKFGCTMEKTQDLLHIAKDLDLNIVGVSFHVGSICSQPEAFARAIGMARQVFDTAETFGFHFKLLDIGGGYPGASGTYDLFDKICYFVNQGLDEHFPEGCGVRIIAEPGCYMVCSAYTLYTTIIGKRMVNMEDESDCNDLLNGNCDKEKCFYYINDSCFGSFTRGFENYHWAKGFDATPVLSKSKLASRPLIRSKIWGATCCSADCIYEDCVLPEMKIGEHIMFENMGAYTMCLATHFNSLPEFEIKYTFSHQALHTDKLPPFVDFCEELGSSQLKVLLEIQKCICNSDYKEDSLRKAD